MCICKINHVDVRIFLVRIYLEVRTTLFMHVAGLSYLKGMVVPQTRVNDTPYLVWALVFKQTGVVHQADCHCIAG